MQTELIKLAHEKGHFSSAKTEEIVKREFFIPNLSKQVQNVIINCVSCILANKKFYLALSRKITTLEDALDKLKLQQKTFGNPKRIITDRGSPFNSKGFVDYCTEEKIQNLQITTGVPRGNGQVERIHRTLIPVLTKLSIDDPTKWYKFVDRLQRILNSTSNRSTKWSPFELLTGVTMRNREDLYLRNLLMEEMVEELQEQRNQLRQDAKRNIQKIQAENKRTYDRKRKRAPRYQKGDLVAIQRTQFGSGLKLRPKFLGPYKVIEVRPRDRYNLERVGNHEGPKLTSSADLMKFYSPG
ncbi:transposon Tf2-6 polyprotein [Trichonephila clavipes]|nr:transposon Tf2-6 polyprotein [Trichonephila clavipes]